MDDWKKNEIELLRSDIVDRLLELGVKADHARSIVKDGKFYCGPLGSNEDRNYLNMRIQRINQLIDSLL